MDRQNYLSFLEHDAESMEEELAMDKELADKALKAAYEAESAVSNIQKIVEDAEKSLRRLGYGTNSDVLRDCSNAMKGWIELSEQNAAIAKVIAEERARDVKSTATLAQGLREMILYHKS